MKQVTILFTSILILGRIEGAYVGGPSQNPQDSLRLQVGNHEIEIRTFEHKLESFQSILESVQEQLQDTASLQKEQIKGASGALEMKINSLESVVKGLVADLQQLKTHANESSAAFQGYKKALLDHEQRFKVQNQNIENLSAALQTILDALQIKTDAPVISDSSVKTYKIKNGDSLDKIAKATGVSVKELMRINHLSSDKIVVGKTLKLAE